MPYISVFDYGAIGDGVADDKKALQDAFDAQAVTGEEVWIGDLRHTFRVTGPITVTATVPGYRRGIRVIGEGRILADYNAPDLSSAVLKMNSTNTHQYMTHVKFEGFRIAQVAGRMNINGIDLTASWFVDIHDIDIQGLSGSGITTKLRPDIHPTISDAYQAFAVSIKRVRSSENQRFGVEFAGGQSPGCYILEQCILANNSLGGAYSTTGQCLIHQNLFVANGSHGVGGGLIFDTAEGAQLVAELTQNEFDTNHNFHLKLLRSRSPRILQNRFLSQTFSGTTGATTQNGTTFMRPGIHVILGDGANECWNAHFEQNYHRSVTPGANPTVAACVGYQGFPSATGTRLLYNDWYLNDGINQNSTGFVKHSRMHPSTQVVEVGAELPVLPDPSIKFYGRITSATQDVYNVETHLSFDVHDINLGSIYSAYFLQIFRAPETGQYEFTGNMRFQNMSIGDTVQWLTQTGSDLAVYGSAITASGSPSQDFAMAPVVLTLTERQPVFVGMKSGAGIPSRQMNVSDPTKIWLKIRKI